MKTKKTGTSNQSGFSMVEMMIVVLVIGILSAMAMISVSKYRRSIQADVTASELAQLIRQIREQALTERVTYRIRLQKGTATASTGDKYTVERFVVGSPTAQITRTYFLPPSWKFGKTPEATSVADPRGLPEVTYDSANICNILFKGDGLMGDGNNVTGPTTNINVRPLSGTIYFYNTTGKPVDHVNQARAVTVFGIPGRTNVWRLYPSSSSSGYDWYYPQ